MFLYRMFGALVFDAGVFEDVEADARATWQATVVVVLSSLATGLGIGGLFDRHLATFLMISATALVTWVAWAFLIFQVGTRILPGQATESTLGQLLRTTGFAAAPGLLQVFAVLPRATVPIIVVTTGWMFAAMVIAVQHALDYRHIGRAVAVCAIGAAVSAGMLFALGMAFSRVVS